MKGNIRYDTDADIAIIILSDKKLAYETEMDDVIVGFWLSGNSSYKHLVDELCWRNIKRLGITNDTNKRISRMLRRNKFVSFVQTRNS